MIIIKIMGGFASQLNKYIFGYNIAEFLGAELGLDISDYYRGYFRPLSLCYFCLLYTSLGVVLDENMRKVYTLWVKEDKNIEAETFCRAQELIHVFCKANDKKNIYSKELMEKTLKEMLFTWFLRNKSMKTMLCLLYTSRCV